MSNVIKSTQAKTLTVVSNMLFHIHRNLENDSNVINNLNIGQINHEKRLDI